jgi:hypothetical protein
MVNGAIERTAATILASMKRLFALLLIPGCLVGGTGAEPVGSTEAAIGTSVTPARTFRYQQPTWVRVRSGASASNAPVDIDFTTQPMFTVSPALPAELSLDASTGVISAVSGAERVGRRYEITAKAASGALRRASVWIELVDTVGTSTRRTYFVSPNGNDAAAGTVDAPFRTITRGLQQLDAFDTLFLRGGRYVESVRIANLHGTATQPITIRGFPGERAYIDGAEGGFDVAPNTAWQKSTAPGAHADEYVSTQTFSLDPTDLLNRGAFIHDDGSYIRLLTYSRVDDLRAANETWDQLAMNDPRPGPVAVDALDPARPRRPWTYFGPGIWYNQQTGKVHIRLSPTHNGIPGITDYTGERDPRKLRLALSTRNKVWFTIAGSSSVQLRHLTIRYGGNDTANVLGSSDILFDHVELHGATYGLTIATSQSVRLHNCKLHGGVPPWSFRSDYKNMYSFEETPGNIIENGLVGKTQRTLILVTATAVGTEIMYSELLNGHDAYVGGVQTLFTRNWVHDLHDEGLFISDSDAIDGLQIKQNVFERVLSTFSFAGSNQGGDRYIYRNLVDLRQPTAGIRPRGGGQPKQPWRWGHPFKHNAPVGGHYVYHNTFLLGGDYTHASNNQFDALPITIDGETAVRFELNNVYIAFTQKVDDDVAMGVYPSHAQAVAKLDDGSNAYRSQANLWDRRGPLAATAPMLRCITRVLDDDCQLRNVPHLADLRADAFYSSIGWEASSLETTATFAGPQLTLTPVAEENLRPANGSPQRGSAVALPPNLPDVDGITSRDIGALSINQAMVPIGINGGRFY